MSNQIDDEWWVKYRTQRSNAAGRDIPWHFTFETWCAVWLESGKWEQRGRGVQEDGTVGYVMGRRGDVGPYSTENVYIITGVENGKEARRINPTRPPGGIVGRGKGWTFKGGKGRKPYEANCAGKYLGNFATEGEARQAYLAAVATYFASKKATA